MRAGRIVVPAAQVDSIISMFGLFRIAVVATGFVCCDCDECRSLSLSSGTGRPRVKARAVGSRLLI